MQNDILKIPIHILSGNEYFSVIKEKMQVYYEELQKLTSLPYLEKYKDNMEQALKLYITNEKEIFKIYQMYFQGKHLEAIAAIKKFVETNKTELVVQIKNVNGFKDTNQYCEKSQVLDELFLVRGRIVKPYEEFSSQEMYHIPLNKRSLVSTTRFSMPGIPALYLSSNTYIVWKELNCPEIEKLTVSYYDLTEILNKKVIDISFLVDHYFSCLNNKDNFDSIESSSNDWHIPIINTIKLIPLIIACSVVCDDKANRNFKEEYVFPQLLMQCLDEECIGIAYNSNRIENVNIPLTNLVIPVLDFEEENEYGKIIDDIAISDSLNLGNFKLFIEDNISQRSYNSRAEGPKQIVDKTFFKEFPIKCFSFNKKRYDLNKFEICTISYEKTIFYLFDEYLIFLKKSNKS